MSRVTINLYIGDALDVSNLIFLRSKGITHIVNATVSVKNFFPGEFVYIKLNLHDFPIQRLHGVLEPSYRFINEVIDKGGTVIVHCAAGISRSSSIVIYYLMRKYRCSYAEALNHLKSVHPRANPNVGFSAQLSRINTKT